MKIPRWKSDRALMYLIGLLALVFFALLGGKIGQLWGPAFLGQTPHYSRADGLPEPVGADFACFYAASSLALAGPPEAVYDHYRLRDEARKIFHSQINLPWHYPPTFLLLVLPLSFLPYLPALLVWLLTTLAAYVAAVRRIAPHPLTLLLTLAFPGIFLNFLSGQNAFLSAALLGWGLVLLDRRPWAGGLLLGLLSYKPQLFPLVPLALVAGRRWQALLAAAAGAGGLTLLSALMLGWGPWQAFLHGIPVTLHQFAQGQNIPWNRMPTAFAALRFLGGSFALASLVQGGAMLAGAATVAWVWLRQAPAALRNAALVLGMLLFPSYLFNYDLALLALPLAWLGWEGFQKGWLPYEPCVLTLAWMAPLFYLPMESRILNNPIAPLACVIMLFLVAWRAVRLRRQAT